MYLKASAAYSIVSNGNVRRFLSTAVRCNSRCDSVEVHVHMYVKAIVHLTHVYFLTTIDIICVTECIFHLCWVLICIRVWMRTLDIEVLNDISAVRATVNHQNKISIQNDILVFFYMLISRYDIYYSYFKA